MVKIKNGSFVVSENHSGWKARIEELNALAGESEQKFYAVLVERMLDAMPNDWPQVVPDTNPGLWWPLISGVQKAIRRGESALAEALVLRAYVLNPDKTLRRFAVIGLEDIGAANLPLCCLCLLVASRQKWVKENGPLSIIRYLAKQLSVTVKDRTLCEVNNAANCFPYPDERPALEKAKIKPDDMLAMYRVGTDPYLRQLAGKALVKHYKTEGRMALVDSVVRDPKLSWAAKWTVKLAAGLGSEGLYLPLPYVAMKLAKEGVKVVGNPMPPPVLLKGIPAYAFDKHTHQGKQALRVFRLDCAPVRKWLTKHVAQDYQENYIGTMVFYVENIFKLHPRIEYDTQKKVLARAVEGDALRYGVTVDQFKESLDLVYTHLVSLDRYRAKFF